jgi:CheY-like chemotaxis protein
VSLVLIVVDEPDAMLRLQADLEAGGYQTILAADADTALERLAALPIDIVVLDVMMPVRDGWSVLEALQLRATPPPAFIVAGRAGASQLARAARLGASGSLASPVTARALRDAVALALAPSPRL